MTLPNSKLAGFTLIEMIVVVVVLAAMAAVIIPSLSSFNQRQNLDQAAKQLKSDLRAMRSQAVSGATGSSSDSSQWGARFVLGSATYQLARYTGGNWYDPKVRSLPGSTTVTSATTNIIFEKLTGVPVGGSRTVTVSLGGVSRSVTVNAGGNIE